MAAQEQAAGQIDSLEVAHSGQVDRLDGPAGQAAAAGQALSQVVGIVDLEFAAGPVLHAGLPAQLGYYSPGRAAAVGNLMGVVAGGLVGQFCVLPRTGQQPSEQWTTRGIMKRFMAALLVGQEDNTGLVTRKGAA